MSNSELEIKKLEAKRDKLWSKARDISKEISKLRIKGIDYTGKFIRIPNYCTIYVTWQNYDNKTFNDERMFLQGFALDGNCSPYQDDFWINGSSMRDLFIPLDTFIKYHEKGEIEILTKEQFLEESDKILNEFMSKYRGMLSECIKTVTNGEN